VEKIFDRSDLDLSLKFGFLGIGMGGSSIAAECANIRTSIKNNKYPYTAIAINTNQVDLKKIPDSTNVKKYQLKGYERGAGRNIQLGEEAFKKHHDEIVNMVQENFSDRDFLWIVCGLGGGTGTGSVIEAIKLLHKNGFKGRFGLILTLPRNKEGITVIENAIDRLQKISNAIKGMGSILLVDNQKLYQDFIDDSPTAGINEYLDYSNKFIAQTLHELNVVTASFNPLEGQHFDSSELLNMITTPGALSFNKVTFKDNDIDVSNESSYLPGFKNSIYEGILSNGYNFQKANRAAVSMVAKPYTASRIFTMALIDKIENVVDDMAPRAGEKPIATYADKNTNEISIYSMFAGLGLPKRISQLVERANELNERIGNDDEDDALSVLNSFNVKKAKEEEFDLDSAFGETASSEDDDLDFGDTAPNKKKKQKEIDPLAGL